MLPNRAFVSCVSPRPAVACVFSFQDSLAYPCRLAAPLHGLATKKPRPPPGLSRWGSRAKPPELGPEAGYVRLAGAVQPGRQPCWSAD
jgi:hypothetical protein